MFGKLSEKMAGVDRKRVYTAAAALLIAGAAGHFMQRGNTPEPKTAMAPATPPAIAPDRVAEPAMTAMVVPTGEAPWNAPEAVALTVPDPTDFVSPDTAPPAPVDMIEPAIAQAPVLVDPAPEFPPVEVARAASDNSLRTMAVPQSLPVPAPEPVVTAPITLAAVDSPQELAPLPEPAEPESLASACDIELSADPRPGALVFLSLTAPCNSGETVEFDHAGLKFSEQLDPEGGLVILAPAMMDAANFVVTFEDGARKTVTATVPDLAEYERLALVWQGGTGLQLHALENGAFYGEAGHIWAETPSTPDNAVSGLGGFVSALGSSANGYATDVYTFPVSLMRNGEAPDVSIEAQVGETTCGTRIAGSILHANPGRAPTVSDLSMSVPGCDAVGEYLVLKNLPQDLKIAGN